MNKKLVAFALSTTALLGAGAMVETTPFSGVAASTAYAYEAPEGVTSVYMRSYGGTGLAQLYSNGTLVMSGGTAASMDFRREIRMATMQFADGIDVVFENSPVLEGSAEDLMSNLAVRSVSGGLVVRGSLADMFGGNETVETVDLTLLEGSEVTNLSRMFRDCTKLTSVALSGWENVAVENMASMFEGCSALGHGHVVPVLRVLEPHQPRPVGVGRLVGHWHGRHVRRLYVAHRGRDDRLGYEVRQVP
jgi:hypothetical protein